MTADLNLAHVNGRCGHGYHPTQRELHDCTPIAPTEWSAFRAAVRKAARDDGTVHACDLRPLLRGRLDPKAIASQYRKARSCGLLVEAGHERSDDERGKNAGRMEPYYRLGAAA